MIYFRYAIVFGLAVALAGARGSPLRAEEDPAFVALGLGYFDVNNSDDGALDLRLEYRHDRGLWIFKPWAGIEVTGDGGVYGVGGVLVDLPIGRRLVVTPSFGAGLFAEGGGTDLGHTIEFRSQIEIAYRFDDRSRLGLAFGHISNAGLGDPNPGSEVLSITYAVPLTRLLGSNPGM